MIRVVFLFLLLLSACTKSTDSFSPLAPQLVSINIIDRNGLSETISNPERLEQYYSVDFTEPQPYQKVLRIYNRDEQGNIPACMTSYHANGCPKQYLEVSNSRACGTYREWHANGQKKIEAKIIAGHADLSAGAEKTWVFDECSTVWDEGGTLIASIPYAKGKLDGVCLYYHANGALWKSVPFSNGVIDGTMELHYPDESLLQCTQYQRGQKEGKSTRCWKDGVIAAEEEYSEGLLITGLYYDHESNLICKVNEGNGTRAIFGKEKVCELHEYHLGELNGEVQVFDQYDRIINRYHVKEGCKHGEEITYYDAVRLQKTLTPKLLINWYEGKVQGVCKTWYQNGIQESQKEMSNNKKNGLHTVWYRDGSLMMIEEYQLDKLVKGEYYINGERSPVSTIIDGKGFANLYDADGNFKQKVEYCHGKPVL